MILWHEAPLYRVVLAVLGGMIAVYCMGALGEGFPARHPLAQHPLGREGEGRPIEGMRKAGH